MGKRGLPDWLDWVRRVQAIAQDGLAFSQNPYDHDRYQELQRIAAQALARGLDVGLEDVVPRFDGAEGYATPKVDVRGAVFEDGRLLLVRELQDEGRWTVPGGWADPWETPRENVEREVEEESGFAVRADKLLAVLDRDVQGHVPPHPWRIYKLFFRCVRVGGRPTDGLETAEARFFAEDEVPELSPARTTEGEIRRLFEHLRDPTLPADFD